MTRRRAAAPYATALFALAKERDQTELVGRELGDAAATFESIAALTAEERGALSAKLGKALGSRQVVLEDIVDRTMLGGCIVESGSIVLDGSLEGQLDRIRRRLAHHG